MYTQIGTDFNANVGYGHSILFSVDSKKVVNNAQTFQINYLMPYDNFTVVLSLS